jgi:hypothetical protein
MDDASDFVSSALKRAVDSLHGDARSISVEDVMRHVPVTSPRTTRAFSPRGRNARIAWAGAVMALVAVVVASVSIAGTPGKKGSLSGNRAETIPAGSLSDIAIVAPGGGREGTGSPSPSSLEVMNPGTGAVGHYRLGASGRIDYPWVVEGDVIVVVQNLPTQSTVYVEGTAMAFRPSRPQAPALSLGPASDVIPSVTPGDVWIVSAPTGSDGLPPSGGPDGQGCTIREETTGGRSLTPTDPLDCRRWIVAAVDGGLLSVPGVTNGDSFGYQPSPDTSPSTNFKLQVWDPAEDSVVRTVSNHASFVLQASDRYIEWQNASEINSSPQSVQMTDVTTGETRTFRPKAPKGMVVEGGPFLAPIGPLVAYTIVTTNIAKDLEPSMESIPCCVEPVKSAQGRMIVEDFETGAIVLDRTAPVSSSGAAFTLGDSFLVETTDSEHVAFIPAWSSSAPVTVVTMPQPSMFSDAEDFTIVRATSG